jgi:hypothetical protein
MRVGFQRFWLSALAKLVTGDENASPKTPHGAYSFPLWAIRDSKKIKPQIHFNYEYIKKNIRD